MKLANPLAKFKETLGEANTTPNRTKPSKRAQVYESPAIDAPREPASVTSGSDKETPAMVSAGWNSAIMPNKAAVRNNAPSQRFHLRTRLPGRHQSMKAMTKIHNAMGITPKPKERSIVSAMVMRKKKIKLKTRAINRAPRKRTENKKRKRNHFLPLPCCFFESFFLRFALMFAIALLLNR
ncbi:MAG: hypothetical protein ACLFVK_00995 [Dehalococcoidia bacterium]